MAKLNWVKTLDMANGEITKVAYKGAEYAKTNEPVKEGDLFQLRKGHSVIGGEINAFYRTYKDSDGDILIPTSAGGLASIVQRNGYGVAFRKISAQSKPTLEQRVGALESDVAALKGEKESSTILALGERVKTRGISKYGYDCDGMAGVIKENDLENGCYYVKLDSGKGVYLKPTQVKKSEETIEFEGAAYRKVDREAREGDVVIFKGVECQSSYTEDGVPYKVIAENTYVLEDGDDYSINGWDDHSVDVYEPTEQAKYVPQEGDIVVITANTSSHANKIGDIGKVGKEEPLNDGGVKVYVPGGPLRAIRTKPCDIRKATPAEVEKYEQAVKDAEITEKWAKIGRKPNEFKKGDAVFVTHSDGGKVYGIIHEDSCGHKIKVDFGKRYSICTEEKSELTLVAPVNSRFNA